MTPSPQMMSTIMVERDTSKARKVGPPQEGAMLNRRREDLKIEQHQFVDESLLMPIPVIVFTVHRNSPLSSLGHEDS